MHVVMFGAGTHPTTFVSGQIDALRAAGVAVSLFQPAPRPFWRTALLKVTKRPLFLTQSERTLLRSADLVHFQWLTDYLSFHTAVRHLHLPVVVSLRGRQVNILPHMPGRERYRQKVISHLPQCGGYHAVSQAIVEEATQLGIDRSKAAVIYTPVDTGFFSPPTRFPPRSPFQIAMVGALIWRKGLEYALQSLAQIVGQLPKAFRMVIVGEGNERDRVEYTVRDLGLAPYVTLTGHLERQGVRDVMRNSHVFVLSSLSEGIANVVIEAMACGLPVIATRAGGMEEAVTHGVEGLVVPTRDVEAMSAAILHLFECPEKCRAMGTAGRQRVLDQFTMERHASELIRLYRRVLQESPHGYCQTANRH